MSTTNNVKSTQLTAAAGYNTDRLVFSEPQIGVIPGTTPPLNYKRILISTKNLDGSVGDLILPTEKLFSFGISENTSLETKQVNGYSCPLCLWNKDAPTKEEKTWSNTFDAIVEACKVYLVNNREEIGRFDLEIRDLKKFNPLYWKLDKTNPDVKQRGNRVPGLGPTLYAKLISTKKLEIRSMFFDPQGNTIDPLSLIGKYCTVKAAIKIESIFIGKDISLQVKLYEAVVTLNENNMKPLLSRPKATQRILDGSSTNMNEIDLVESDDEQEDEVDEQGSVASGSDEEPVPEPVKPKRKIKRITKKTT